MKLKEKLAKKAIYQAKLGKIGQSPQELAYIAGFNKARELIVEELKGSTGDATGLDIEMSKIGEEEVEGDEDATT